MNAIGQYEVLDLLGDGGMGTVHRGRDPRFDRPVAIKVLHSQYARDPEVSERFRAEAVIQAKLNHPNIVTVYDFLSEGDQLAMVMELVEGQTLAELIAANPHGLPEATVVTVMSQVLSAVGFAHGKGLVHRDLKPSNVMVQDLGDGELVAKVMDFGIAKILGAEKMRTATSAKMGTLAYMSPEQLRSPKSVDHRSDIYSLGAMLYEMLTGTVPFDAESEYELMRKAIEEEPPAPSRVVPDLGFRWDAIVARAMAKEPAHRFQSSQEMRAALEGGAVVIPGVLREAAAGSRGSTTRAATPAGQPQVVGRMPGQQQGPAHQQKTAPTCDLNRYAEWWAEIGGRTEGPFLTDQILLKAAKHPRLRVRSLGGSGFVALDEMPDLVAAVHDSWERKRAVWGRAREIWFSLYVLILSLGFLVELSGFEIEGFGQETFLALAIGPFVVFAVMTPWILVVGLKLLLRWARFPPDQDSLRRAKRKGARLARERRWARALVGAQALLFLVLILSWMTRGDGTFHMDAVVTEILVFWVPWVVPMLPSLGVRWPNRD